MDLFGDLPPPSGDAEAASLFDDLPLESTATPTGGGGGREPLLGKRKSVEEIERETPAKLPKTYGGLQLKGYIGERRGEREDMQDAHTIIDDFTANFSSLPNKISRVAYYGVFDGHAGSRASTFASENLHKNITTYLPKGNIQNLDREVKKCLLEAFKKTDEDFLRKASDASPSWKDGSTVASILVLDDTLYSANLGDSKAVLCRRSPQEGKHTIIPLTKDHNPTNFDERRRIEKAGGTVREGRVMGIVEVSRSIGDGRFKLCGIISVPDVLRCQLTENDLFIIIACDGLWKVFSTEEAATFVSTVLEDPTIQLPKDGVANTNYESTSSSSLRDVRCEEACNRLAVEAVKKGCTDNVTVMLIDIQRPSSHSV